MAKVIKVNPVAFDAVVKLHRDIEQLRDEVRSGGLYPSDIAERIDKILEDFNEASKPPASRYRRHKQS